MMLFGLRVTMTIPWPVRIYPLGLGAPYCYYDITVPWPISVGPVCHIPSTCVPGPVLPQPYPPCPPAMPLCPPAMPHCAPSTPFPNPCWPFVHC